MEHESAVIFSGTSHPALAEGIAKGAGVPLGEIVVTRFPDGEISVTIEETVRGRVVFVVQSVALSPNEHLMELLVIVDALKRASAKSVVAVVPYFGYCRQDRKDRPRVPITARLVADLLEGAGVNHLLTMDLHAPQVEGFFDIPVDNLLGVRVFVETLQEMFWRDILGDPSSFGLPNLRNTLGRRVDGSQKGGVIRGDLVREGDLQGGPHREALCCGALAREGLSWEVLSSRFVVAAPDLGSVKIARSFSSALRMGFVVVDKRRNGAGEVEALDVIGDVEGKNVLLADDMCSTGGTLVSAAKACQEKGARCIFAVVTHGVFVGKAVAELERSAIRWILATDSVVSTERLLHFSKLHIASCVPLFSQAIRSYLANRSLSALCSFGAPG